MSGALEWWTCAYCNARKYTTKQLQFEHLEECPKRPRKQRNVKLCPKCGSCVTLGAIFSNDTSGNVWFCNNATCDYELTVLPGGKANVVK